MYLCLGSCHLDTHQLDVICPEVRSFSDSLVSGLNWVTFCTRQSRLKAQLCRRIIMNESVISPSPYFSPPPHFNPRSHHHRSVCVPLARTASFQSSFFLFLSVICGTAFLSISAYLPLALSRQHCFTYHDLISDFSIHYLFYILLFIFVVGLLELAFACYSGCTVATA